MFVLIGIACLLVMCASILLLASVPISQYTKRHCTKMNDKQKAKDTYSLLFDVYERNDNRNGKK